MFNLKSKINNLKYRISNNHSIFSVQEGYNRWAAAYPPIAHNPLMRAEQQAMLAWLPDVRGARVLDLACGTGRYARIVRERGAAFAVGLDFSRAMLARASLNARVCATMMRLPMANNAFDLIVSGLAVAHTDDLLAWMREIARVLRPGGALLYSDFHPSAARVGLKRTFRASDGRMYTIPHRVYTVEHHQAAARAAGLQLEAMDEVRVGREFTEAFDGSDEFYRRWRGLPLVLVIRARRP